MSNKRVFPPTIAGVEALMAMRALCFAQEIGLSSIIMEGDSKVVINSLKSDEEPFASLIILLLMQRSLQRPLLVVFFPYSKTR